MCRKATCRTCSKTTWAGCGMHVDQVMRGVPAAQRCTCGGTGAKAGKAAVKAPAKEPQAAGSVGDRLRAFFRR